MDMPETSPGEFPRFPCCLLSSVLVDDVCQTNELWNKYYLDSLSSSSFLTIWSAWYVCSIRSRWFINIWLNSLCASLANWEGITGGYRFVEGLFEPERCAYRSDILPTAFKEISKAPSRMYFCLQYGIGDRNILDMASTITKSLRQLKKLNVNLSLHEGRSMFVMRLCMSGYKRSLIHEAVIGMVCTAKSFLWQNNV